jgi:hypothetical protein
VVLIARPTGGRLRWPEAGDALSTIGAKRRFASRGIRDSMTTE